MQNRLAFPMILMSAIVATIFALLWWSDRDRVYNLTLATGGELGEYYEFGEALAEVVARHNPQIQIEVLETQGSRQNVELIAEKKAQLALVQSDTPLPRDIQVVSFLFPEIFHLVARTEADINNVKDLEGKRIALMPEGSGSYQLFWYLSRHYGLDGTDFEAIPMPSERAYVALQRGQVDAMFRIIALGNSTLSKLLQTPDLTLISIEQGAALQLFKPALEPALIPKGTYNGSVPIPSEDLPVVGVRSLLIARENINPYAIYEITRILFERRNDLLEKSPQAAMIVRPDNVRDLGLPFHPGAQSFYTQHEPSFLEKYAEPMGFLLSAGVLGISSLWQFRVWLKGRQKNNTDFYNLEILNLIDRVHDCNTIEELDSIREQLFKIFREVVVDLDEDRISPESFQSFTFTWEAAVTTIRHRETLL